METIFFVYKELILSITKGSLSPEHIEEMYPPLTFELDLFEIHCGKITYARLLS